MQTIPSNHGYYGWARVAMFTWKSGAELLAQTTRVDMGTPLKPAQHTCDEIHNVHPSQGLLCVCPRN
eukprot:239539-Amphidinium_carterae.7